MVSVAELKLVITGKDEASAVLKGVGDSANGLGNVVKVGVAAVAGLGAVAAGGIGISVKAAADFQQALSQVGAVANATSEEMAGIHDAALRIGKDTAFSASEAAAAMGELAAQGVSAKDILGGAADATVALAAAGGTDLVTAATAASSAMNIWHLQGDKLTDVVNRLTGAANVSSFGVEDMTQALASGGIAASTFKIGMEDTTTALAALAKGGFQSGSDAGTSFKAMLTGLAAPMGSGAKAIAELGINVRDANGNMKDVAGIIDELHLKLDGLSQEDRDAAMAKIFGSDGMRAAGALMQITGDQFRQMSDEMGSTDAAAVAAVRMDNFKGSLEQLKGSLEVIEIEVGEKFLPVLTKMADWGAANLPKAFDFFETKIAPQISAFATSAKADIDRFVTAVQPALEQLAAEAQRQFARFKGYYQSDLKPAFDNIVTAVEYVVQKFKDNWGTIGPVVQKLAEVVKGQLEIIGNAIQIIVDILGGDWKGAWENTKQLIQGVVENWKDIVQLGVLALKAVIAIAKDIGEDIINGLKDGALAIWNQWVWPFFKGLPSQIKNALGDLSRLLWDVGKAIAQGLLDGLVEGAKAVWGEVSGWGDKIKSLKGPMEVDRTLLKPQGYAISVSLADGLVDGFNEVVVPAVSSMAGAIKDLYAGVPDYVKKLSPAAGGSKSNAGPYIPFDTSWYVGGGQSVLGPGYDDASKIPIGSFVPGLGYKTANGWEQTLGAAADIDAAYRAGTYGQGGGSPAVNFNAPVTIVATDREEAIRSTRDVSFALRAMGA